MAELTLVTAAGCTSPTVAPGATVLAELLERGETFWLDVQDPGEPEIDLLSRVFGFPPLAMAEVLRPSQMPWVDIRPDHILLVLHAVEVVRTGRSPLHRVEVDCLLQKTCLVTVHRRPLAALATLRERWSYGTTTESIQSAEGDREVAAGGMPGAKAGFPNSPDLLLCAVVDAVTGDMFAALDFMADRVVALEERVFSGRARELTRDITGLRRSLVRLRHGIGPQHDALGELSSASSGLIGEAVGLRFRQAMERLSRLWEGVELERDLIDNVVQVYLGLRTDRLNLVMQRLTLITTIFMPLTLITGIYGMNFHFMPELSSPYGYPAVLAGLALVGYGMYRYFRARGWFGEP